MCNQADGWQLTLTVREIGQDSIDCCIEDGSHKVEEQIYTCLTVMRLLPPKAIYVIEDVSHTEIVNCMVGYDAQVVEFRDAKHRDDKMLVVKHWPQK